MHDYKIVEEVEVPFWREAEGIIIEEIGKEKFDKLSEKEQERLIMKKIIEIRNEIEDLNVNSSKRR